MTNRRTALWGAFLLTLSAGCSSGAGIGPSDLAVGGEDPGVGEEILLAGTLGSESADGGCLSLETEGGTTYQLVGPTTESLEPLSEVTVRGSLDPEAASPCMSAPVFRVSEVLQTSGETSAAAPGGLGSETLTGRMGTDSVEGGCTYLEVRRGDRYELIFERGVEQPEPPADITVRGEVQRDMVSTCMIGPIFLVTEVLAVEE